MIRPQRGEPGPKGDWRGPAERSALGDGQFGAGAVRTETVAELRVAL